MVYRLNKTSKSRYPVKNKNVLGSYDTFKNRNLTKGELGVLSSVNQKLWLQYKELVTFLDRHMKK